MIELEETIIKLVRKEIANGPGEDLNLLLELQKIPYQISRNDFGRALIHLKDMILSRYNNDALIIYGLTRDLHRDYGEFVFPKFFFSFDFDEKTKIYKPKKEVWVGKGLGKDVRDVNENIFVEFRTAWGIKKGWFEHNTKDEGFSHVFEGKTIFYGDDEIFYSKHGIGIKL